MLSVNSVKGYDTDCILEAYAYIYIPQALDMCSDQNTGKGYDTDCMLEAYILAPLCTN